MGQRIGANGCRRRPDYRQLTENCDTTALPTILSSTQRKRKAALLSNFVGHGGQLFCSQHNVYLGACPMRRVA